MKALWAAVAISFGVVFAASVAEAAEAIRIRFSHVVGEATPKGVGAQRFKALAEQRLAGRVAVEIFPRAEKFDDEEVLLALLFGDVELAAPSFVQFQSFSRAFQVFDLPFLFKDVDHVHRFQESDAGHQLLQMVLPYGIQGLAYWDNGMRAMSAERPIRVPTDAAGLRFRIEPSKVFQEQYRRIGVVGIPIPFSRVTDAIREGLVDGQENAWSNIYSRRIHKLHDYHTELNHSFLGYMVVSRADFWQNLPPDVATTLQDILREVTLEVNQMARETARSDREKAIAEGKIEVHTPTGADLEVWRKAFLPVWSQFEKEIGGEILEAAVAAGRTPTQ
jgi:C4-dicarboxylate-binding protein DctP